jgi:hypothetical protein
MLKKIVAIMTIASLCLLLLLLNITAPTSVGPFGILAVFIFSYLASLGICTYLIFFVSRLVTYLSVTLTVKKPISALTFRDAYYYSTVVAIAPVMLVGLQSVNAIGIYEYGLVALFVVIGWLYITKRIR